MPQTELAPAGELNGGPYVGLRPFEPEDRRFFFGREQDSLFLADKIATSPVTLLYARSGFGKSSLLRALTIPHLVEDGVLVLYFDHWTGDDPAEELRARLLDRAHEVGVVSPEAASPTLSELTRLLADHSNQPVVLILDQFEEFLVHHGSKLDPLKRELARIGRFEMVDIHLVLSLREEFLAALEPFRYDMPNLFQATYRLAGLDDQGVRTAIRRPAEQLGGSCTPELVEALVRDLKRAQTGDGVSPNESADLPMLQLLCSRIWEASEPTGEMTLSLYQDRLGGSEEILDAYVRELMPERWRQQLLTARMLRFLAPPSGLKTPYSPEDLVLDTGLAQDRVAAELARLCRARILRSREFRGNEQFELQHDAFIRILEPWRDEILARADRKKRNRRVSAVLGGAALLIGGGFGLRQFLGLKELHRNTKGVLAQLCAQGEEPRAAGADRQTERYFDRVVDYLLQGGSKPEAVRFQLLASLLQEYEDCIPREFGLDLGGLEALTLPGDEPRENDQDQEKTPWPIQLEYSSSRNFDKFLFTLEWQKLAREVAVDKAIPVPLRLHLQPDPALPRRWFRLIVQGSDPIELHLPDPGDRLLFESELSESAQRFLERFSDHFQRIPEAQDQGGAWRTVPHWSLPVWKAYGARVVPGSGWVAHVLLQRMTEHPEAIVPPPVAEALVRRVEERYPFTAEEARRARGEHLAGDLAEILHRGSSLRHLPLMLDVLAAYPGLPSAEAADRVALELRGSGGSAQNHTHGPWRSEELETKPDDGPELHEAYLEAMPWVAQPSYPIRVHLGESLKQRWIDAGTLRPQLVETLESARDSYYLRTGIELPSIQVVEGYFPERIETQDFVIQMLGEDEDARPAVTTSAEKALEQLESSLAYAGDVRRSQWFGSEGTARVIWMFEYRHQTLGQWIRSRYSITDLKLLLRAVAGPQHAGEVDPVLLNDPGRNLRKSDQLLASLVFWTQAEDSTDIKALSERLRQTSRGVPEGPGGPSGPPAVKAAVERGVLALGRGDSESAKEDFSEALRRDREGAIRHFVSYLPVKWAASRRAYLARKCESPERAFLPRDERLDIQELLEDPETRLSPAEDRRFRSCLLANLNPGVRPNLRREVLESLLETHPNPTVWSAAEAAWLVPQILAGFDPLTDDPRKVYAATRVAEAALKNLDRDEAITFYLKVYADFCQEPGPKNWCWNLLEEMAQASPRSLAPIHVSMLAEHETLQALQSALGWTQRASAALDESDLSPEDLQFWRDWVNLSRAIALLRLSFHGDQDLRTQAEELLNGLLASENVAEAGHAALAQLLSVEERWSEARALLDDNTLERWPSSMGILQQRIGLELVHGDTERAIELIEQTAQKVGSLEQELYADAPNQKAKERRRDFEHALFVASLGHVLLDVGDWEYLGRKFLLTNHEYVNYVAMMLYTKIATDSREDAKELLEHRLETSDRSTWPPRLRAGDPTAWREMLLAYSLGQIPREEIFGPLESPEAFANSDFSALPIPRRGLLCEAYFYDALLAASRRDEQARERSLKKVLETGWRHYLEYDMAQFLLTKSSGSPSDRPSEATIKDRGRLVEAEGPRR